MYTRKQYLNHECTHSEYYGQFVTEQTKRLVKSLGIKRLKNAYKEDEHFNSIPLGTWDNLTSFFRCDKQLRECGDYATLAGKVCILKETARRLVNENNN